MMRLGTCRGTALMSVQSQHGATTGAVLAHASLAVDDGRLLAGDNELASEAVTSEAAYSLDENQTETPTTRTRPNHT
eukprot:6056374-Amphidinium_carterae.1